MAGGIFSGHTESGGDLVERGGKKYKEFYGNSMFFGTAEPLMLCMWTGMSSSTAMHKHSGGVAEVQLILLVSISFLAPKSTAVSNVGGQTRIGPVPRSRSWNLPGHPRWHSLSVLLRWRGHHQGLFQTHHLHSSDTADERAISDST